MSGYCSLKKSNRLSAGRYCTRRLAYFVLEIPMNPILNTALKAARRAGAMMVRASGNLSSLKINSKAFNDLVSDVDRESENIILQVLQEAYPHHKITTE